jgi:ATP-dependent helicase/nuclease subunit A
MLVEAAAGTGKTTILISRMVSLLVEGKSVVETMAAVTFTRKAATELRARFQLELERAFRQSGGRRRARLAAALSAIDRCFIGTIHSFCGRLLRERPVEAGVDVSFEEMDETEDQLLKQTAWDRYVARLYAEGHPILR